MRGRSIGSYNHSGSEAEGEGLTSVLAYIEYAFVGFRLGRVIPYLSLWRLSVGART